MDGTALSQMRSTSVGAACCTDVWGYLTTLSRHATVYTRATLRHFDTKVSFPVQNGPLIPWERRLAKLEILENQEVTSGPVLRMGTMTGLLDIFQ